MNKCRLMFILFAKVHATYGAVKIIIDQMQKHSRIFMNPQYPLISSKLDCSKLVLQEQSNVHTMNSFRLVFTLIAEAFETLG